MLNSLKLAVFPFLMPGEGCAIAFSYVLCTKFTFCLCLMMDVLRVVRIK